MRARGVGDGRTGSRAAMVLRARYMFPVTQETGLTSRLLHGAFQTDGRVSDLVSNINMSCVCKFFSWETASCYCLQSQRMSG